MADQLAVSRLTSYPVVSDSIKQMANLYESTKQKSNLVRYALEKAETVAGTVVSSAKDPVLSRYEKQIASINTIALSQLDKLEDKYPIMTKPTSEVYQEGVKKYDSSLKPTVDRVIGVTKTAKDYGIETVQSVKKYSTEKAVELKDYGIGKVSDALKTPYGQVVAVQVDKVLDVADNYVDYYLPKNDNSEDESSEEKDTVSKALTVSNKLRRRMLSKSLQNIASAKQRSQEALEKLHFTVDLIQYTQSGLTATQQKLWDTWEEINKPVEEAKDEDGNQKDEEKNQTMERRAIMVARRLTAQIKTGIDTMKSTETPEYVQEALKKSYTYSEEMYNYFRKVIHYDEISAQVLDQHKDKITYIKDTLYHLTDLAFARWPVNALKNDIAESSCNTSDSEIEMTEMHKLPEVEVKDLNVESSESSDEEETNEDERSE